MLDAELLQQITAELIADEGIRFFVYDDHNGQPLRPATGGRATIGVGRNVQDRGISRAEAMHLLANDIHDSAAVAREMFPGFDAWTRNRQAAIVNLIFNIGERGFRKFERTIDAMRTNRWGDAADHLGDSKWATQVQRSRSERIIKQVREG